MPGEGVRTYVVWVPMNRALERDVANATKEIWDARARHYWDADGWLMRTYQRVLGARHLFQHVTLQFGGPPKTLPSIRRGQDHDARLAGVGVELRLQRGRAGAE